MSTLPYTSIEADQAISKIDLGFGFRGIVSILGPSKNFLISGSACVRKCEAKLSCLLYCKKIYVQKVLSCSSAAGTFHKMNVPLSWIE
jgi:hypothetical protein